jgi:hypothetical protein
VAAGQGLEPNWEVYRQNLHGHVVDWMEKYLSYWKSFQFGDAYENDPVRYPNLLPCTQKPINGESMYDFMKVFVCEACKVLSLT